jgi:hypothetical protein
VVDDEDEEPFEPNSAVISTSSRQDLAQNRPEPGGRFPSDLEVTAQRGLQVPLSPSSSSGVLNPDHDPHGAQSNGYSDREIIAAAAGQPGSGVGDPYTNNRLSVGHTYGNTPSVIMDEAPSHAAIIDQQARQDGVNPYSGEPALPQRNDSTRLSFVAGDDFVTTSRTPNFSQDSGLSTTPASARSPVEIGSTTLSQQLPQVQGNGHTKLTEPATVASQRGESRPMNARTDSTPHVPGEYPRGSIGGTLGNY